MRSAVISLRGIAGNASLDDGGWHHGDPVVESALNAMFGWPMLEYHQQPADYAVDDLRTLAQAAANVLRGKVESISPPSTLQQGVVP